MSWAGKKSLRDSFRGLFSKKEQAPSFDVQPHQPAPVRLAPQTVKRLDRLVGKWVDGKGYRIPDKSIEQSASRIGTDSVTLYRYFQLRGEDFRSFRTRLRLEDAKEQMLREPQTSASVIAYRVGFSDRGNFTRQFKSHYGITPDEWRKSRS